MPAATVDNLLVLPRVARPEETAAFRPVNKVVAGRLSFEGEGFQVRRPFPGELGPELTDPFLLLDHLGAVEYAPGEAKGAPWHPHRGFETVTYIIDGAFQHHDSTGGGGLIADGDTQWMTAGAGILHDELPTDELKWTPPRYQDIGRDKVKLLTSEDGGALVRLIAGELAGNEGPGVTWTP